MVLFYFFHELVKEKGGKYLFLKLLLIFLVHITSTLTHEICLFCKINTKHWTL